MVLEIFTNLLGSQAGMIILLIIFIVFIFLVRKIIRVVISGIWIAFVSALFPVFLKFALGYDVPLNIDTFLFYITLGLGLFSIYLLGRVVYSVVGVAEKGVRTVGAPFSYSRKKGKEAKEKKMEKFMKKQEKKQKEERDKEDE